MVFIKNQGCIFGIFALASSAECEIAVGEDVREGCFCQGGGEILTRYL